MVADVFLWFLDVSAHSLRNFWTKTTASLQLYLYICPEFIDPRAHVQE